MSNKGQRKRSFSAAGLDSSYLPKGPVDCPKFIIIHLNVLVDGRAGITHTIRRVFERVIPDMRPPAAVDIIAAFATTPILSTILRMLTNGRITSQETSACEQEYMRIWDQEALPMISNYTDVKDFLRAARANGVTTMVQADFLHKALALINDDEIIALVDTFVDTRSAYINTHKAGGIVSLDNTNIMKAYAHDWARRKQAAGFDEVQVPEGNDLIDSSQVMVLSCTAYGLRSANIVQAKACWVKKSEGVRPHNVKIDLMVDSLAELGKMLFTPRIQKAAPQLPMDEEPILESIEVEDGNVGESLEEGCRGEDTPDCGK